MSSGQQMNKRGAFVLPILLVAMAIILMIAPALLETLKLTAEQVSAAIDRRTAVDRALSAVALLRAPVFYCGYGMPSETAAYQNAFFAQKNKEPFCWDGPVCVSGKSGRANAELRLAYGMPSGTSAKYSFSNGGAANVALQNPLTSDSDLIQPRNEGKPSNVKNWVLFGAMMPPSVPFAVKTAFGNTLGVQSAASGFVIPEGEEVYLLRAVKAYCENGCLYTENYRSSGAQPRVQGIVDMRFELDKAAGTLTVYVVSRGNLSVTGPQNIDDAEDWPEEYKTAAMASSYRLYATKITWGLPNCLRSELPEITDISARF